MKLDRKQKIILTLIIIAAAYLIWQIYDMFFANAVSAPATMTAPTAQSFQPINNAAPTTPAASTAQSTVITMSNPATPTATTAMSAPKESPAATTTLKEMTLQAPLSPDQVKYLQLVSRYQLVKMQRMVTDEEAALVGSKEKIAELNQQIAKFGGATSLESGSTAVTSEPSATSPTGYQLMYIDYQNGRWTATLNKNGQFQETNVGSTLSDGTRILKIDQNGVVISQDNKTYLLNFYGSTELANAPSPVKPKIISSLADAGYTGPALNPLAIAKPQHKAKTHSRTRVMTTTKTNATHTTVHQAKATDKTSGANVSAAENTTPVALTTNEAKALLEPPKTGLPLSAEQKDVMLKLESGKTITATANADTRSNSADENYLLGLPNNEFTLQVLGSHKLSDLTNLVTSQQLQGKAYIFHTYYLGKDWYILVYGAYKSKAAALEAIKTMPQELQTLKPWVRSIADVKAAIKLTPQKLS